MKKNLLTLIFVLAGLTAAFGQTEWTSTSPLYAYGITAWYDAAWSGSYDLQKGSVWTFEGTYPQVDDVDSVYCNIVIADNVTWGPGPDKVDITVEKGDADGAYEAQLTIPMDWTPVDWEELGAGNYDRPIIQTRVGYDSNVFSRGVPPKPGDAYHNLIGGLVEPYTDSILLLFDAFDIEYTTQDVTTANVNIATEIKKGQDSLRVRGNYGITDLTSLTIGIYDLDASSWAEVSSSVETIVDPAVDNPGIFDYYYVVDPAFTATEGNWIMIQLSANYTAAAEAIWFWAPIVDYYTPDSIAIDGAPTAIEFEQVTTDVRTMECTVFPDDDANDDVVWSIDDASVIDIDAATGVLTWATHDFADGSTASVVVTATINDTITASTTIAINNNIANGLEDAVLSRVSVYPNPATDQLTITGVENAIVTIHNLLGAQVMSTELENSVVSIESLPAGTYFVEIKNNEGNIVKKIYKQ